jgi:hypothetical protein
METAAARTAWRERPYFLGLQWLYKRKSAFFWGIAEDAAYLAEHIAARM